VTLTVPRRIAVLGFGLIGGSIAGALSLRSVAGEAGRALFVTAWSPSGRGPREAFANGVVDRAAENVGDALDGAELVVLAAPPLATVELIERLATDLRGSLGRATIVTDVTSTKVAVMAAATRARIRFVGGHPMAGLERTGYRAADASLFVERPWVVVPPVAPDPDAVAVVDWLARSCGAHPVHLGAAEHDAAAAAISHLPLVAAAALVEAIAGGRESAPDPAWPLAQTLAAGGWASMTRLARGDARMGAGIAASNASELAADLRRYRGVLDAWIAALESPAGPDPDVLEARLRSARDRLTASDTGSE
jgi:prephenate dehydrogenase